MGKYKLHPDDIREMSPEERREKLRELKAELLREMTSKSVAGVPENPGRVREIKRNIARILTIEREEELKKIREAEKR
ncbi:MAG: 50S ribosomal protein L29 [Euryarchaeota archaeon]